MKYPEINLHSYGQWIYDKRSKEYTIGKEQSLFEKTGQPYAKEQNWTTILHLSQN